MKLTDDLKNAIDNFAASVRKSYKIDIPINDINVIINNIGGKIQLVSNSLYKAQIIKENDTFIIEVDNSLSKEKRLSAIAHELGHLFLHMGYESDFELWDKQPNGYKKEGYPKEEYEANYFVESFLLPEKDFKLFIDKNKKNNTIKISEIAKAFNVSNALVINRGYTLGLFE